MPAPASATYSDAAKIAANTSFLNLINAGAGAGFVRLRSSTDVLLAQVPLSDPAGTVSGGGGNIGQLVFSIAGPDSSADATGTAAYAQVCDSTGLVHLSLPAVQGTVAVSGVMVLTTLAIAAGAPVQIVTGTVG